MVSAEGRAPGDPAGGLVTLDDRGGGVRLATLNDPRRRNAMGTAMAVQLVAVTQAVLADDDARVLVVTGEGDAFCAGADLPELFGDHERPVSQTRRRLQDYYRAFHAVRELPIPTIAAVDGPAVGAGLNLAMACDLRVAGPGASFGATFTRIGLAPGGGCTWFLVQALGSARALRTLLLGEAIDARRAVDWGLAEAAERNAREDALALAARIAGVDPFLARWVKRAVGLAVETGDLGAVLEYESWAQAASASSEDLRAWVQRFRE